jgi:hypothetical protein
MLWRAVSAGAVACCSARAAQHWHARAHGTCAPSIAVVRQRALRRWCCSCIACRCGPKMGCAEGAVLQGPCADLAVLYVLLSCAGR